MNESPQRRSPAGRPSSARRRPASSSRGDRSTPRSTPGTASARGADAHDTATRPVRRVPAAVAARRGEAQQAALYLRRRLMVLGGCLAALVIVVVVLVWPRSADPAGPAASSTPSPSAGAATPSPTVSPIERADTSEFAQAPPDVVLDFALVGEEPNVAFIDAGALEAYTFSYANGSDADAVTVAVVASQWPNPQEAVVAAADIVTQAGAPTDSGDVLVAGTKVGTYAVVEYGDGTATAVWANHTAVFQATGPTDSVRDLYDAYPL